MNRRGRGRPREGIENLPTPPPIAAPSITNINVGKYRAIHMISDIAKTYMPGDIFTMNKNNAQSLIQTGACVEVAE